MKTVLDIEIWSDITCPYCYIGKRHMEAALADLGEEVEVKLHWRSYQLDPNIPEKPTDNLYSYLAKRFGSSEAQVRQLSQNVTDMAAGAGLTYRMDEVVLANSLRAHLFLQYAKRQGKGSEAKEKLLSAYFCEGKDIANLDFISHLAQDLDFKDFAPEYLDDPTLLQAFEADEALAASLKISGVPFFRVNGQYHLAGAQAPSQFSQVFARALKGN